MKKSGILLVSALLFLVTVFSGCSSDKPADQSANQAENGSKCISCHTDSEYLIKQAEQKLAEQAEEKAEAEEEAEATEEVTAESLAEGWLVSDEFMNSTHGKQNCEACHKGDPQAEDKETAHAEKVGFVKDPTEDGGSVCSSCHGDTVEKFKTSLHYTQQGIRNGLMERLGTTPHKDEAFDTIFSNECSTCHATCGQCHISNPTVSGGGLKEGHVFTKEVSSEETCMSCHESEYYDYEDVHSKMGLECTQCHSGYDEMHGYGNGEQSEWDPGVITADCTKCHQDIDQKNDAHKTHNDNVDCYACHAKPYPNCFGCHKNDVDKFEEAVHLGRGEDGKITTFVHLGSGISGYEHLGITLKEEDINKRGTWVQWRPHSIAKAPIVKEGAEKTCDNCHGNPDIFISEDELDYPELDKDVIVKKLPKKLK